MSSKKDKRKSFGDSKAASTAPVPIETNEPVSTSGKSPKKRKNHASAEDSVDLPSTVTAATVNVEEPSKKRSRKGKEQDKSIVVDDAESKPEEGSTKSRKKEKKHDKLHEQTPTKSEQDNTRVVEDVTKAVDCVIEDVTEGPGKKTKKKKKGLAGEEASGSGVSTAEDKSKMKEKALSMDTEPTKTKKPVISSEQEKEAEGTMDRKKSKKKGKKSDTKEGDTSSIHPGHLVTIVTETSTQAVETPAPKLSATPDTGKKMKQNPDAPKPTTQASPMTTKPKSASASRTSKAAVSSMVNEPSKKTKKAKAKEPSPSPEPTFPSDDVSVEGDVRFDSEEDDEVHLHGFSTDDDDSSDEEGGMNFEATPLDVSKLPTVAKDDATVKRKLDKAKRQLTEDRGVLFLGRLPHGFYEDQLKAYFSQFGTVTRLRVSRNKKTGRSKHYAFLEFDSLAIAQIVADTMDNYLLMGHILRCKIIPKDEVHPELWIGANRKWRPVPRDRITRVDHNKPRTADEKARAAKRLVKRQNARKRKLAEAGIEYDFDAVSYKKPKEAEA